MLMALDLPLPKKVYGHGWLLLEGGKMSKSKGNVVDPVVLCERYGVDAIRYFLLREFPFGSDGVFSNEALINRINAELANDLGNLVSRTTAMIGKYFDGVLPAEREADPLDDELIGMIKGLRTAYEAQMEEYAFQSGLAEIMKVVSRSNKYIDETAPWVLGKDETKKARLATVLYNLAEAIRVCGILLTPFMPDSAEKIRKQIGAELADYDYAAAEFGRLQPGFKVEKGETLFPRIDIAKELAELEAAEAAAKAAAEKAAKKEEKKSEKAPEGVATLITIDDFAKVELRVCQVKVCEPVPKADKLLRLELDDGEGTRQVVSGIHTWYEPEDLIGKKVVIVANLKPAKLRGVESHGMILAADAGENDVKVLFVDDSVPAGSKVR